MHDFNSFNFHVQKYPRPANYQFQILQQTHAGRVKTVNHLAPATASRTAASKQPMGMTINNTFKQKTSAVVTSGFNSLKRITAKTKPADRGPGRAKTTDSKWNNSYGSFFIS